jgi:hypothetical protein
MLMVDRRLIWRGRNGWACKNERGCAAQRDYRGLPQVGCGPKFVDGQGILAYAANAVAISLAAMNANVSAGPRVPPEPG